MRGALSLTGGWRVLALILMLCLLPVWAKAETVSPTQAQRVTALMQVMGLDEIIRHHARGRAGLWRRAGAGHAGR